MIKARHNVDTGQDTSLRENKTRLTPFSKLFRRNKKLIISKLGSCIVMFVVQKTKVGLVLIECKTNFEFGCPLSTFCMKIVH